MKAIKYNMKRLIRFVILPRDVHESLNYPEYILRVQKELII